MKQTLTIVHVSCVAVVCVCFGVSVTLLKGQPLAQQALVGAGFWLWGKLGFAPSKPVVERMALGLSKQKVGRVQSVKPPTPQSPADAVSGATSRNAPPSRIDGTAPSRPSRARSPRATAIRRYLYDEHVAYDQGVREHPHIVLARIAPDAHDVMHLPLLHAWVFKAPKIRRSLPPYVVDLTSP